MVFIHTQMITAFLWHFLIALKLIFCYIHKLNMELCFFFVCYQLWCFNLFSTVSMKKMLSPRRLYLLLFRNGAGINSQQYQSDRCFLSQSNNNLDANDVLVNVANSTIGWSISVHRSRQCRYESLFHRFVQLMLLSLLKPIYRNQIATVIEVIHCFRQAIKYYSDWPLACIESRKYRIHRISSTMTLQWMSAMVIVARDYHTCMRPNVHQHCDHLTVHIWKTKINRKWNWWQNWLRTGDKNRTELNEPFNQVKCAKQAKIE